MLDIAKTIWEVAKGLLGYRSELKKAERDQRDRVADYFSGLAQLVEATSASLKERKYPSGSCSQLGVLVEMMPQTLAKLIPDTEVIHFQSELRRVHEIEKLFMELQSLSDEKVEERLRDLDEAAGYFRAITAHMRVSDG